MALQCFVGCLLKSGVVRGQVLASKSGRAYLHFTALVLHLHLSRSRVARASLTYRQLFCYVSISRFTAS